MRHIIIIVTLFAISITAKGQTVIPFASGRTTDTAYTPGWLKVGRGVLFPFYASSDTNRVLGIDANGKITLRVKSNGSTIDTTSLSNRINAKVSYSDSDVIYITPADLNVAAASYVKYSDTSGPIATNAELNTAAASYVKYTDTTGPIATNAELNTAQAANTINAVLQRGYIATDTAMSMTASGVNPFNIKYTYNSVTGYHNTRRRFALEQSGGFSSGTGILSLSKGNGAGESRFMLKPNSNATLTLDYPFEFPLDSGIIALTKDSVKFFRKADSNTAGGALSYSYWLTNRTTGTVTSITAGTGLSGGTITSTGTISLSTPVAIANGGTNNSTGYNTGRPIYYNGTGFAGIDSVFWDNSNNRLGIRNIAPSTTLDVATYETAHPLTLRYRGTSGGGVRGINFLNTAGQSVEIGIIDNARNMGFKMNGTEYYRMTEGSFIIGQTTLAASSSATNLVSITGAIANTSGVSSGIMGTFTGGTSTTGGVVGINIALTGTHAGSGVAYLARFGRNATVGTADRWIIDTGGQEKRISPQTLMGTADTVMPMMAKGTTTTTVDVKYGTLRTMRQGAVWSVTVPTDANYTVPSGGYFVELPTVTANRNVVLPTGVTGAELAIINLNTSGTFNWTFTSGTVKDLGGNTITTLTNATSYRIVFDGTKWQMY